MIIGIDASRANRFERSGPEWVNFYLLKYLAKIDSHNTYWLYSNTPFREDLKNLPSNFILKELRWPYRYLWTQGRLSLEMLWAAPDIFFLPASIMPLIHPKNTLVLLHDIAYREEPELYRFWSRLYHRLDLFLALRSAKKIITVSDFTKSEILKGFQIPENRLEVMHLGYDPERFHPHRDGELEKRVLEKYGIRTPFVLTIANLYRGKKKNFPRILKAFQYFHSSAMGTDHQLVCVGKYDSTNKEIPALVKKLDIADAVLFTDWVPSEDLPVILRAAQMFLFPSLYEGFGIPVLEAFASGVPVISSGRGALYEIAKDAAFLVDPEDTQEIYLAMKRIAEDTQLSHQLHYEGLERAKNFSWETAVKKLLNIFERSIERV